MFCPSFREARALPAPNPSRNQAGREIRYDKMLTSAQPSLKRSRMTMRQQQFTEGSEKANVGRVLPGRERRPVSAPKRHVVADCFRPSKRCATATMPQSTDCRRDRHRIAAKEQLRPGRIIRDGRPTPVRPHDPAAAASTHRTSRPTDPVRRSATRRRDPHTEPVRENSPCEDSTRPSWKRNQLRGDESVNPESATCVNDRDPCYHPCRWSFYPRIDRRIRLNRRFHE